MKNVDIREETKQKEEKPYGLAKQGVEIPASWFGRKYGVYSLISRTVTVNGTVEIAERMGKYEFVKRVQYGTCKWNKFLVLVINISGRWKPLDRKPIE